MSDSAEVQKVLSDFSPELVLLPAAMTHVDNCERSPTLAWEVNAEGAMNVALTCRALGAKLLYVSTDYVFNGLKGTKYYEFETPDPVSVYGQTKLEGERVVLDADKHNLVCRVSVLYGWNRRKDNFVTWMIKEMREGREVKLFDDQYVSPTYAPHCARAAAEADPFRCQRGAAHRRSGLHEPVRDGRGHGQGVQVGTRS